MTPPAQGGSVFKVALDQRSFFISSPRPPDSQFRKHLQNVDIGDERLFSDSSRVTALNLNWTFKGGMFGRVYGVVELSMMVGAAKEGLVDSEAGLKEQLLSDFRRDLTKFGYRGESVEFENVLIRGRRWLTYDVPITGVSEFTTALSPNRFLVVRLKLIDNSGFANHPWRSDATKLMVAVLESIRLE